FIGKQGGAFHEIGFRDVVIGVGEALGELCVVRQDEEPAGVEIEAAYGGDELSDVADEVINGGAPFGIFACRDVAGGLVEQDVNALLTDERLTVERDAIAGEVDPEVGIFDG